MRGKGINPDFVANNPVNNQELAGNDMDRLEQLNLDQKDDDQEFYDQFNPMAGGQGTNMKLKGQNNKMDKNTAAKIKFQAGQAPANANGNSDQIEITTSNNANELDDLEDLNAEPKYEPQP